MSPPPPREHTLHSLSRFLSLSTPTTAACLAVCSGTTVSMAGACPPPTGARPVRGGGGGGGRGGDPLASHPLAGLFAWSSDFTAAPAAPGAAREGKPAAAAGLIAPPLAVNASDIKRFASKGLALVGAARVGTFTPALHPPLNVTLAARAGAAAADSSPGPGGLPVTNMPAPLVGARDVVYTVDTRLLYASRAEVSLPLQPRRAVATGGGSGDLAGPGLVSTESTPGFPGEEPAPPEGGGGGAEGPSSADPQAKGWIVLNQWNVIASKQAFPNRAATWLTSAASGCSGSFIGPYVVASAAHCVYDRAARKFMPRYDARPAAYRTGGSSGSVATPYGATSARYYAVMAGWQTVTSDAAADPFDVASITMADPKGQAVGFLGLAVDVANGVAGDALRTAGYPQSPPSNPGTFVAWKQPCYPANSQNGGDAQIATYSPAGGGACPAAEQGQSGSALWDQDAKLRAVLSRGAPQMNIWCELNQANYDFFQRYKGATPTNQPAAPPPGR